MTNEHDSGEGIDTIEITDPQPDPDRHLRAAFVDKVRPGDFIQHGEQAKIVRLDSEKNLWDVMVDETPIVTVDVDDFVTTTDLGVYLDQVLLDLAKQEAANDDDVVRESRAVGDKESSGAGAFQ